MLSSVSVQMTYIICIEYSNTYESVQMNIFICNCLEPNLYKIEDDQPKNEDDLKNQAYLKN